MKTIVVLTDFSEEAFRAAEYACEIADCLQVKKIVLYNAHSAVVAFGGSTDGTAIVSDDNELYLESMESLRLLRPSGSALTLTYWPLVHGRAGRILSCGQCSRLSRICSSRQ